VPAGLAASFKIITDPLRSIFADCRCSTLSSASHSTAHRKVCVIYERQLQREIMKEVKCLLFLSHSSQNRCVDNLLSEVPTLYVNISSQDNADRTNYTVIFRDQKAGRSRNVKTDNSSFERVEQFRQLGTTLTN